MAAVLIDCDGAKSCKNEDLIKKLSSDMVNGLSSEAVLARRNECGYNEISEKKESLFIKFLKNFWGPIPWMIEVAIILSIINQDWKDVAIIGFLLIINVCVEFLQEFKAGNAIEALKKRLASTARVLRDGKWNKIEARELVPGDIIRIRLGDIVPADVKLLDGEYLLVDEAALTGESLPVEKYSSDIAYSGAIAKQGEMVSLVYGTGGNTFFGRTASLVARTETKSHFQKAVVKIGDYLIALNVVLVAIIIMFGLGGYFKDTVAGILQFCLVLTVASIPAALPTVLSVTMAVGAVTLSKKGAIISKLVAIEEMAGMEILCSDKTGTITKNELTVVGFMPFSDFSDDDIKLYGALASKAENQDPIDNAIIVKAEENDELLKQIKSFEIIKFYPFDPVSKRTESVIRRDAGEIKVSKGAPQVILDLAHNKDEIAKEVTRVIDEAGEHGYRTLGVAKTDKDGKWHFVGIIDLNDPPRDDSATTIKTAKELGVKVKMITGDHGAIAKDIAAQVNIGTNILEAEDFTALPDRKALKLVEEADGFSQVFPEHKFEIVELLQKAGNIVGMTGDGVNDAPALKKADTGIAVHGATDAAKSAADIVFTLPGLSVIIDAIKESRRIFQRMQSYAIYRISETQDVLFFTVAAILTFHEYPVTAVMIVLLAVFNDFPIMTIANDNVKYSKKPEDWNMRKVIGIGTVLGITNVLFTFLLFYLVKNMGVGFMTGGITFTPDQVKTLVFAELAIAGNLTIFLSRTRGPFWSIAPGKGLVWSSLLSKIFVSCLCAFGWQAIQIAGVGWWVLGVWGYAIIQMLITDRVKIFAYGLFDHKGIFFKRRHLRRKFNSMKSLR
ncbi:MAG: plasma-membrane proton-efflux P-type ATPase [Desulfobacteraceae bacterium]|nr:plasma-membrane proton-efflux P-type ATPase [Desulfobacteraceae bacterium]